MSTATPHRLVHAQRSGCPPFSRPISGLLYTDAPRIGVETAATAAQPRVEQVAHRGAEHVQAVHDLY